MVRSSARSKSDRIRRFQDWLSPWHRIHGSRPRSIGTAKRQELCLEALEDRLTPALYSLAINPAQSSMSLNMSILNIAFTAQSPGSLSAQFSGNLTVDYTADSLKIEPTARAQAFDQNGPFRPGNTSADMAGVVNLGALGSAFVRFNDFFVDMAGTMAALVPGSVYSGVTGEGSTIFSAGGTGLLANIIPESNPLVDTIQLSAPSGNISASLQGNELTIQIPFNFVEVIDLGTGLQASVGLSGIFVAIGTEIPPPGPDLQITGTGVPAQAAAGSELSLGWQVQNAGNEATTQLWSDTVVLSTDSTYSLNDVVLVGNQDGPSSLAPLGNYSRGTFNPTIPQNTAPGDYFIIFVTDNDDTQAELNDSNNTDAKPITITAGVNGPNLQITAPALPTTVERGTPLSLEWTVTNAGNTTASQPWQDRVYLSLDQIHDANDQFLTTVTRPNALGASASYTVGPVNALVSAQTPPGNYFVLFVADWGNLENELNETDNILVQSITVTDTTPPTIISFDPISMPFPPSEFNFGFSEDFDLSTITADDFIILAPNGTPIPVESISRLSGFRVRVTFAPQPVVGTYSITIKNSIADLSGNNLASDYITSITAQQADYTVDNFVLPSGPLEFGSSFNFQWRLSNLGNTFQPVREELWIVSNSTGDRRLLSSENNVVVGGSESVDRSMSVELPFVAGFSTGDYYFEVLVDPNTQVNELFENNNAVQSSVVNIAGPTDPFLTLSPTLLNTNNIAMPFTIVSSQSYIGFGSTPVFGVRFEEQVIGSSRTKLAGNFTANFTPQGGQQSAFSIPRIDLRAIEKPAIFQPGDSPGNFALDVDAILIQASGVVRNALAWTTDFSGLLIAGSDPLTATFDLPDGWNLSGIFDYRFGTGNAIKQTIDGFFTEDAGLSATMRNEGGYFSITVPFKFFIVDFTSDPITNAILNATQPFIEGEIVAVSPYLASVGTRPGPRVDYDSGFNSTTSSITLKFSEAMDEASVVNPDNYVLTDYGPDGVVNDDDNEILPVTASYNQALKTVTLTFSSSPGEMKLQIRSGPDGIRAADGRQLDGDGDFISGDDLTFVLGRVRAELADVNVPEDAADTVIDLKEAFGMPELIRFEFAQGASTSFYDATIENNQILRINYKDNQFGSSQIKLRATLNSGGGVEATLDVNVASINDAPTIEDVIADQNLLMNSGTRTISLANVFGDVESVGKLDYSLSLVGDKSIAIVTVDPLGFLRITPQPNAFGETTITVRATDEGELGENKLFVETSFKLTIGTPTPDGLEPDNGIGQATGIPITVGSEIIRNANLHVPDDIDTYFFELTSTVRVRVETIADRLGGTLDSAVELLTENLVRIVASDDAVGRDAKLEALLEAGKYYIRVTGDLVTVGPYQLSVSTGFPNPTLLRMSPENVTAGQPSQIALFLDDLDVNTLNSSTVIPGNFQLLSIGSSIEDISARIVAATYDANADRILLTLSPSLSGGRYRVLVTDRVKSLDGRSIDDQRIAGNKPWKTDFIVDRTPPTGSFQATASLGGSAESIKYRFAGNVVDLLPIGPDDEFPGSTFVTVSLDVDGDGFDDGSVVVNTALGQTQFKIDAQTPIPTGVGNRTVRARLSDGRQNQSILETVVNTNLPTVAKVSFIPQDGKVLIVYNVADVQNAAVVENYNVSGRIVQTASYSPETQTATLLLNEPLVDGSYTITIRSGQNGVSAGGLALDGDGNVVAGENFDQTFVIDRAEPEIGGDEDDRIKLVGQEEEATPSTNGVFLRFKANVSDIFPSTSTGTLTPSLSIDGGPFVEGQTIILNQSGTIEIVVPATVPLAEGSHKVVLLLEDSSGNKVTSDELEFNVDRTGLGIEGASAQAFGEEKPTGIQYSFIFSDPIKESSVGVDDFRLYVADGNGQFNEPLTLSLDAIAVQFAGDARKELVVNVDLLKAALGDGRYRLIVNGEGIIDDAGNPLRASDFSVDFDFVRSAPEVIESRTYLQQGLLNKPTDRVIIQFEDVDLEEESAKTLSNYALEDASGAPVELRSATYDRYSDRVILTTKSPLAVGEYLLTVEGVKNTTGAMMLTSTVVALMVDPPDEEQALSEQVLQGNADAFDARAREVLPELARSIKDLTRSDFVEQLRTEIAVSVALGKTTAQINDRVTEIFTRERKSEFVGKDYLPPEFVIVWAKGARFLLIDPTDDTSKEGRRARIGQDLTGARIEEIEDAVLQFEAEDEEGITLAIVPLFLSDRLIADPIVRLRDTESSKVPPDLRFQIELEGLDDRPLAGLVYFASTDRSGEARPINFQISKGEINTFVSDLSEKRDGLNLDGFDPNIKLFNTEILAGLRSVLGPLDALGTNLLVLWFDPVDFILSDSKNVKAGSAEGAGFGRIQEFAGAFYNISPDGFTELLVIPNARADIYDLDLYGVGARYRGAVNFFATGGIAEKTGRLQGYMTSLDQVVAKLDFGLPPIVTPPPDVVVIQPPIPVVSSPRSNPIPQTGTPNNQLESLAIVAALKTSSSSASSSEQSSNGSNRRNAALLALLSLAGGGIVIGVDGGTVHNSRENEQGGGAPPPPPPPIPPAIQSLIQGLGVSQLNVPENVLEGVSQFASSFSPAASAVLSVIQYLRQMTSPSVPTNESGPPSVDARDAPASEHGFEWVDEWQEMLDLESAPQVVDEAIDSWEWCDEAIAVGACLVGSLTLPLRRGRKPKAVCFDS